MTSAYGKSTRKVFAAIGIVAAAAVAGCAPGSAGSTSQSSAPGSSAAISTVVDTSTPVTLTLSDGWGTTGTGEVFGKVIEDFEKKYPNVTVKRETTDYATYQQTVNLKGNSTNPPDIMMLPTSGYGQGFYNFASDGRLLPLDEYAKAYGWDKRFGDDANLNVFRLDPSNHNQWGSGTLFGLPEQNAQIGVFYNKALLTKAGVSAPPKTIAEFEQSLAAAKSKGITPIAQSSTFIHTLMAVWDGFAGSAAEVNDWIYGASGTFANQANLKAAEAIQNWQKSGYFQDGAVGTSDNDTAALFLGGKTMYFIAGSWMAGGVEAELGADGGWFPFPSSSPKSPVGGGLTTPLVISSKTKNPDVAAAFLNYFTGAEASAYLFQNGWGIPGAPVPSSLAKPGTPTEAIIKSLAAAEGSGGAGTTPFLDWANPAYGTMMSSELQKLAAGKVDPAGFTAGIQAEWQKFHDTRKS